MNLFAIVDRHGTEVLRIRVEQRLQAQLRDEFEKQRKELFYDKNIVNFDPRYKADDDELFVIEDFKLPDLIRTAVENINQVEDLSLNVELHIKSLFAADRSCKNRRLYFQRFMRGQLLTQKWTLLGSSNTYRKLEEPGLMLGSSLAAFYEEGQGLYFRSYAVASQFLDLESYFTQAADSDIEEVLQNDKFEVEDVAIILESADSIMRKRFMALKASGVLDRVTVEQICHQASRFGIDLEKHNDRIVFPKERKKAKELLRFLLEGYYDGPLTGTKYVTNSHRAISDRSGAGSR